MPITMNLSGERKHSMKSFLTVIGLALAFVSPAFAGIDWGFPNNATTVAGTSFGSPGSGTATIAPGTYGSGWQDVNNPMSTWSTLGHVPGASGLWDLGGTSTTAARPDRSYSPLARGAG